MEIIGVKNIYDKLNSIDKDKYVLYAYTSATENLTDVQKIRLKDD